MPLVMFFVRACTRTPERKSKRTCFLQGWLLFARLICGLAIGMLSVMVPIYITEAGRSVRLQRRTQMRKGS